MNTNKIYVFTDGACRVTTGEGGYCAIIERENSDLKEKVFEGFTNTTNNRMEMMAVIAGLESIETSEGDDILVTSDSQYVINAFKQNWIWGWMKRDWNKSDGKPVKNIDLWKRMLVAMKGKKVTFEWVRGHNGHPENEECDRIAVEASHGKYGMTRDQQ